MNSYKELYRVLDAAASQASYGKGQARHAEENEPFEKQKICEIGRRLSGHKAAGPLFQAVKKIYESGRLEPGHGVSELYGAINYIAAAIILMRESLRVVQDGTAHVADMTRPQRYWR